MQCGARWAEGGAQWDDVTRNSPYLSAHTAVRLYLPCGAALPRGVPCRGCPAVCVLATRICLCLMATQAMDSASPSLVFDTQHASAPSWPANQDPATLAMVVAVGSIFVP